VGKVKVMVPLYFAMEIRGSVRRLSGNKDYLQRGENNQSILTRCYEVP